MLLLGDCLEILPVLPKVDAVITSPEYDNLRSYGGQGAFKFKETADLLRFLLLDGAVIVWIVGGAVSCWE